MKCPICGTTLPLQADRCPDCGYRCKATQSGQTASPRPSVSSAPYTPPNKSNKSWGCCCCGIALIIPLVILIAVIAFSVSHITTSFTGGILGEEFFDAFPFEDMPFGDFSEDLPFGELTPESLPAPADEGCFVVADRTLMFLRDSWDGSPVLRIPDTVGGEPVNSIGAGCFAGCEELTTILLPDSVTIISPMAFSGCSSLRGLFLPDGVELIGRDAFSGCAELEAIRIPVSVTTIAPGCFDDCASLRYIFYGGSYDDWNALYQDYITPFTAVFCLDGDFYHGAGR